MGLSFSLKRGLRILLSYGIYIQHKMIAYKLLPRQILVCFVVARVISLDLSKGIAALWGITWIVTDF
jgi:hypothetical protein